MTLLGSAAADAAELYKPHVVVTDQRANLDPNGQQIHALLTFQSRVPLPVQGVRVGFLLAGSNEALKGVDVYRLYTAPAPAGPVPPLKAVPFDAPVNLPPKGTVTATMSAPLDAPVSFEPQVFLTHVLGYHLGDVHAETLLDLVTSTAKVDQAAACEILGLLGDANAKAVARQRWGKNEPLRRDLIEAVQRPAPAAPEQADTFRRIYAVRALGVLGGPEAYEALSQLAQNPNLGQFDAPLTVLQRARQESGDGTVRVPLALAVPEGAVSFAAVVQAALIDVGLEATGGFFGLRYGIGTGLMVLFVVGTVVAVGLLRRQRGNG